MWGFGHQPIKGSMVCTPSRAFIERPFSRSVAESGDRILRGMSTVPALPTDAALTVIRHPSVWWEALRVIWAVSTNAVPVPHEPYLRWRALTAYGDADQPFRPDDLLEYLRWRKRMRRGSP